MSTTREDLELEEIKATVRQMGATVDHMRAEQEKWQAEQAKWQIDARRETIRLVLYGLLVGAALLAAGAALGEWLSR